MLLATTSTEGCHWLPVASSTCPIDHNPLSPTLQLISYLPTHLISSYHFGSEDTMRHHIIHHLPLIHTASYLIIEGNVAGQAECVLGMETA